MRSALVFVAIFLTGCELVIGTDDRVAQDGAQPSDGALADAEVPSPDAPDVAAPDPMPDAAPMDAADPMDADPPDTGHCMGKCDKGHPCACPDGAAQM
jgi:hypothetical protein